MSSRYVPVSELVDQDLGRVNWQLNLPDYAPSEAIGIQVQRLGRLARLGGFKDITVSGYTGEITKISPSIDSVDKFGTATASSRATIKKAELQKTSIYSEDRDSAILHEYVWPSGNVSLNLAEIDTNVGDKGGLREPKIWSKEIDTALRQGIREASKKNLVDSSGRFNKIRNIALVGLLSAGNMLYGDKGLEIVQNDLVGIAGYNFLFSPAVEYFARGLPFSAKRYSIFPGVQHDRVLAVNGISRVLPIAKALNTTSR